MIVPMKKAEIAILREDRERFLAALQRTGCLMPITTNADFTADTTDEDALVVRTERALRLLEKHRKGSVPPQVVPYAEFATADPARLALLEQTEAEDAALVQLRADLATIASEREQLLPWSDLPVALDRLGRNGSVYIRPGFIPPSRLEVVRAEAAALGAELETYGNANDGIAAVVATSLEDDAQQIEQLRVVGFAETSLPRTASTPAAMLAQKDANAAAVAVTIAATEARLADLAQNIRDLELLNDQTASAGERKKTPFEATASAAFLVGWVRSDRIDDLRHALDTATEVYDLTLVDPGADEVPPTAVKNNRFVSAFETITDMFAKPSYNELDPNPALSFWYWMLFGMMMADVGYGAVMIVLFAFLIKKLRAKGETLKLLKVLMFSGITTMLWGFLFNSYFGASIGFMSFLQILTPMEDALTFLLLSLVVGILHIFTGLGMKAANNIRRKDYLAVVADSLSWILLISGLGMLFLGGTIAVVGKWMAFTGAGIVVLFAGRSNKNPFARIGAGLYALYGTTGFLGDIMSYARILALSLSSAVIAYVINMLAGMIQGSVVGFALSLVVYVVGHVFNLVMGLLSAYVHTSRLQFIEFFTKFYDGAGYEFRPLAYQLKYLDSVHEEH